MPRVGVLALQGDVREHVATLEKLGVTVVTVRTPSDLEGLDGLVMPGGESTTIAHLLVTSGLRAVLQTKLDEGFKVFGTCAGLIMLSRDILDGRRDQWSFNKLDVAVRRNGYGRQIASFESSVEVRDVGVVPGVFIRAPKIESYEKRSRSSPPSTTVTASTRARASGQRLGLFVSPRTDQ